jgi:hypothetical protein
VQSVESQPMFRRNILSPSSRTNKPSVKECRKQSSGILLDLFVHSEDGGDMFLRNVG